MGIRDCSTFATLNLMLGTLKRKQNRIRPANRHLSTPSYLSYLVDMIYRIYIPVLWRIDNHRKQFWTCDFWTHNGGKEADCTQNCHAIQIVWIVNHLQNLPKWFVNSHLVGKKGTEVECITKIIPVSPMTKLIGMTWVTVPVEQCAALPILDQILQQGASNY